MTTFVGFGSPVVGRTKKLYDVELVKRGLLNHFYTRKGERVMDSTYGFIGWDLIFELDVAGVKETLETDARRIIELEIRVKEISINIQSIEYGYVISIDLYFVELDTTDELKIVFDQRALNNQSAS